VLSPAVARDPERVSRFHREAEAVAALNHPNIAEIYGLEESNSTKFLVLELVEGRKLDERIKRGPIPVDEALNIATQILEAVEAAHERGVVHRDLKPANVKITEASGIGAISMASAGRAYPETSTSCPTESSFWESSIPKGRSPQCLLLRESKSC